MIRVAQRRFAPTVIGITRNGDRHQIGIVIAFVGIRNYVELSGELGADWGACTNELSQYDGQLVFEHWTCREWEEEKAPF